MAIGKDDIPRLKLENAPLPTNDTGHIISPLFLQPGCAYLDRWRQYCRKTPKEQWPEWLRRDVGFLKGGPRVHAKWLAAHQ